MSDAMNTLDEKTIIDFHRSVSKLLEVLGSREKDILEKRFKLQPGMDKRFTLEDIGKLYEITRERVRQIEADSIKKLRQLETLHEAKQPVLLVQEAMDKFLREHGGAAEESYLLDEMLHNFSPETPYSDADTLKHKEALLFIISQILGEDFDKISSKFDYHNIWKLKDINWDNVAPIINEFIQIIEGNAKPLKHTDILETLKNKPEYPEMEAKFFEQISHLRQEMREIDEVLLSYLKMSKKIKKNLFAEWGMTQWNTISPKKINDKIYLIMKKAGKPLHFNDITAQINEAHFDHKKACAATVHNELILDKKYVLVGRGIYALREWGYEPGTVSEVIAQVLKNKGPLNKQEILEEVNKQRIVKQATVNLALMNKSLFRRVEGGKYDLVVQTSLPQASV